MNLYVTSFQTQTIKHESQFSQSLYLFGFDFWIGISLFFFYTMCSSELYEKPSLIYILDEVAIPQSFQRQIKTCAVYPNSECQCRLLQTYLMNEYFWIVFTILFYQSSIAYFILLDVFYVFKSAATTFPQFFSLPSLAVTLNVNRLFCGMKISHLRLNWLLIIEYFFPVNCASCEKE